MGVRRRDFLFLATLAAAAASVTAALGQAVTPAVGPTGSGAQSAASIPDFSGIWSHPVLARLRTAGIRAWSGDESFARARRGPQRGLSDPRQLVSDYTNPILKPQAAEFGPNRCPTFFGQLQCGCFSSRTRSSSFTASKSVTS